MTGLVVCLMLAQAAAVADEPRAEIDKAFAEETPRQVRLTLKSGKVVAGKLLLRDDMQMLVLTAEGEPVQVDTDQVTRFEEPLPNRNRSHYLFASSALMSDSGQVSLTQVQALATLLEVGIGDNFSFQLGTAVPAYFLGKEGINAYGGVKAGTSFNKWLHLAVELKLLLVGALAHASDESAAVPAIALAALTATAGNEDMNITVSAGPPLNLANISSADGQVVGVPLFIVSGFIRVYNNVGFMTENWFVPNADPTRHRWFIADTLAARFFGERWAVDLGLIVMPSQFAVPSPVPAVLPWLNFSYHFI